MIEAIIFDMDGVLVDTEPVHFMSYQKVLRGHGVEITENQYNNHWIRDGKGIREFIQERSLDLNANQIRAQKRKVYQEKLRSGFQIFPGAREVLESLISENYSLALATSSYKEETNLILDLMASKKYFKAIVTCDDVKNVKPSPECFLLASQRLEKEPRNTLVIEDAEKGVIAAKNAGMYCIAIRNRLTQNHNLSRANMQLTTIGQLTPELISSFS